MHFDNDYWNALDRAQQIRYNPQDIGISHGIGEVGEGLKANIFRGASLVELGFMGQGKGFRSQPTGHTPESYGAEEREEMRQLAKINEVQITTHASPNIGSAAGFGEGGFRKEAQENVLHEVERAIHFAADVGQGGPVVMHVGEFERPIFEADEGKFRRYPEEEKRAPLYFVDEKSGSLRAIPRSEKVLIPDPNRVDEQGNPLRDEKTGQLNWITKTVADLEQEAKKKGEDVAKYVYSAFQGREKEQMKAEEQRFRLQAKERESEYKYSKEMVDDFEKMPDKERRDATIRLQFKDSREIRPGSEEYKQLQKDPLGFLKERTDRFRGQKKAFEELADSYHRGSLQTEEAIKNLKPVTEYGVQQTAETISRAAMYAYELENKYKLPEKLWIAPENWTPELYGAHPRELKEIIVKSRECMAEKLEKDGMGKNEADQTAKDHIKATLDIGHLNFWKKYFEGSDAEFKSWIDKETKALIKDGIIGHVHLSDNFGYHDEHLAPGQGNVPIEQFLKNLKEGNFEGKIVAEPGGQKEGHFHRPFTETLKLTGSPVYRLDGMTRSWTDIEGSYFGRAPQSPYFLAGDLLPSKDWSLWSELGLE